MSHVTECTFNKNYLATATILFIEDDDIVRQEAAEIFSGFFKKVIIASDATQGIDNFIKYRIDIDVILTNINMPQLTGIQVLSEIRKLDWEIPILLTTTFDEIDILIKAIKFNVTNYIVKPIQLNTTLKIISKLMQKKQQKKELAIKNNELRQFMAILDSYNIICELDINFKITSANDSFLANSGFSLDELIGKEFTHESIYSNSEVPDIQIKTLLQKGRSWSGTVKKVSKHGSNYYTYSTILPIFFNDGRVKKYIEFATSISKFENEILALKKHIMLLKSQNFKASSELKKEKQYYEKLANKLQMEVDDSVNNAQRLLFELYEVKKRNNDLEEKLKFQEKRFEEFQATMMCGQ